MEMNKGMVTFHAKSRKQWRSWLQKHSQTKAEICLIVAKKSAKGVHYDEAVEEALCFGWIDSLTNARDGETFYQRFSPRKPTSGWSQSNKDRVLKLQLMGLMTEHGQKLIDLAIQKGKW